jgi:hypothetical protein
MIKIILSKEGYEELKKRGIDIDKLINEGKAVIRE